MHTLRSLGAWGIILFTLSMLRFTRHQLTTALQSVSQHRNSLYVYTLTMARLTWEQTAGGKVRTARSTRGNTGTRAGPNGAIGRITYRLDPRVGPLHRETAWLGVGLRAD